MKMGEERACKQKKEVKSCREVGWSTYMTENVLEAGVAEMGN
jgi:hypothetical protein